MASARFAASAVPNGLKHQAFRFTRVPDPVYKPEPEITRVVVSETPLTSLRSAQPDAFQQGRCPRVHTTPRNKMVVIKQRDVADPDPFTWYVK